MLDPLCTNEPQVCHRIHKEDAVIVIPRSQCNHHDGRGYQRLPCRSNHPHSTPSEQLAVLWIQGQPLPAYAAAQSSYVPVTAAAIAAQRQQTENLANFWREQMTEIEGVGTDAAEFKNHQLPLARIKKVRDPCLSVQTLSVIDWRDEHTLGRLKILQVTACWVWCICSALIQSTAV